MNSIQRKDDPKTIVLSSKNFFKIFNLIINCGLNLTRHEMVFILFFIDAIQSKKRIYRVSVSDLIDLIDPDFKIPEKKTMEYYNLRNRAVSIIERLQDKKVVLYNSKKQHVITCNLLAGISRPVFDKDVGHEYIEFDFSAFFEETILKEEFQRYGFSKINIDTCKRIKKKSTIRVYLIAESMRFFQKINQEYPQIAIFQDDIIRWFNVEKYKTPKEFTRLKNSHITPALKELEGLYKQQVTDFTISGKTQKDKGKKYIEAIISFDEKIINIEDYLHDINNKIYTLCKNSIELSIDESVYIAALYKNNEILFDDVYNRCFTKGHFPDVLQSKHKNYFFKAVTEEAKKNNFYVPPKYLTTTLEEKKSLLKSWSLQVKGANHPKPALAENKYNAPQKPEKMTDTKRIRNILHSRINKKINIDSDQLMSLLNQIHISLEDNKITFEIKNHFAAERLKKHNILKYLTEDTKYVFPKYEIATFIAGT